MKASVQTTREFTFVLTEEEATALGRLASYVQLGDLSPALERAQLKDPVEAAQIGDTLIELLKVTQKMLHDPSSR